jgi:hypothetical protein
MIKEGRDRDKCVYTGLSEDPDSVREKKSFRGPMS